MTDLLPGQCWADMVSWALDTPAMRAERGRLPWRPIGYACRQDYQRSGSCYCGAMRQRELSEVARWYRSECCHAPVEVVVGVKREAPEEWAVHPLRCMACGQDTGCLVDVEQEARWVA